MNLALAQGFENVHSESAPDQLLATLQQGKFDLLLLDLELPAIDGISLLQDVRRVFPESALPILCLITDTSRSHRAVALSAGASDFLNKPVDAVDLSLRLKSTLSAKARETSQDAIRNSLEYNLRGHEARLDMLIENGLMMSMERDRSTLLRHILVAGQKLLHCEGATLYLVTPQNTLRFTIRTKQDEIPSFEIPLYAPDTGLPNEQYVSTYVALHNQCVVIDDVYQETRFDLRGTRQFDAASNYRTVSMLTVPMSPRGGEVIGVLQFMNALDATTGAIVPFSRDLLTLIDALSAQAAVALDNLQLVEAQKTLMDSMIQVLATAIDAKSPYTGRHCNRVPELAMILAKAAHETHDGPLADFGFATDDEWREFRIGAWLHDCGKVTTPEFIIDKATKLETIYNRIHEVRMRFEVLLRDAEIARLNALRMGVSAEESQAHYASRKAQLFDDFHFIAQCNIGGEAMTDDKIVRLRQIADMEWTRHFDDRDGISQLERDRRGSEPVSSLPAVEKLLADKPRDIICREGADVPDPAFGFKMDVPEYLYNRGEIYNLGVRRGTLTAEERYKINEHMVHTIMMLERMNFPKSLKRVPEYAGGHHEKLDGRGYPRKLSASELSIPARIMAIADVFEALTASDRPYKQPNKVSEAIRIMFQMKKERHIDPDIFDLFLTSGASREYATRFLSSEQNDAFDFTPFLGPVAL